MATGDRDAVESRPHVGTTFRIVFPAVPKTLACWKVGIRVLTAGTAREGDQMARDARPDPLLLDQGLPDGDGLELVRRLRAEPSSAIFPC